ncbi:putative aminoacrylate hydrolase-like protein [Hapsidospora chrysogenum ATCC 11550]|uniref:Putative aminoacrylate hydrolase-like protein n=1 Tax=Hapsidospora chrysogenum (strain ATCC 11550 / CBS 779.69 / DSM 880 / IAM 14645 / JCM 23072 / IMI 49137) TaxID=857340 RepID=A0A086T655_HAPC1|nr:putative aminoacrylate hydrolase-like protein [Hapsidospora chrysogenum ATCC 11550]
MATTTFRFPSIDETTNHPAYPSAVWNLKPDRNGLFPAAKDRGGPVNIAWEIHGTGPTKLLLIMGLAGVTASWQRQTRYFGHDRGDQYSVLIMDNRGMGASDKPLARYSTSAMARDIIEVLDHVGWTGKRQVHAAGISLGGMIAQELACLIPERLASLSLLCTSGEVKNTDTVAEWIGQCVGFVVPKSAEQGIVDTARKLFPVEWLEAPDADDPPSPETTSGCGPAPGDGKYRMFDSNFQRFQAQELTKKRQPGHFTRQGFLCQLVAAWWHRKTPEQLAAMADAVGRERMLVMHGTGDVMIKFSNGERLMDAIKPGTAMVIEGMGHVPVMERYKWCNEVLHERFQAWAQIQDED